MNELGYLFAKIKYKIKHGDKESVNNFFRNAGVKIGENCTICCNILSAEPYLIEIGNDVTISGNVLFVTHDNSVAKFFGGVRPLRQNYCGQSLLYWSKLDNYVWGDLG